MFTTSSVFWRCEATTRVLIRERWGRLVSLVVGRVGAWCFCFAAGGFVFAVSPPLVFILGACGRLRVFLVFRCVGCHFKAQFFRWVYALCQNSVEYERGVLGRFCHVCAIVGHVRVSTTRDLSLSCPDGYRCLRNRG